MFCQLHQFQNFNVNNSMMKIIICDGDYVIKQFDNLIVNFLAQNTALDA